MGVFTAIGTGVGAYFGGPTGAAVGGAIGSSLDNRGNGGGLFSSSSRTRVARRTPIRPTVQTRGGGFLSIGGTKRDPTVAVGLPGAGLREESLAGTRGLLGQVNRDIQTMRGLENPFIRARVRPLERRRDSVLADIGRDFGRRGVTGSLRARELTGATETFDAQIADQRAIAQTEALNAVFQRQGFVEQLNRRVGEVSREEMQQALAELGIAQDAINAFIRSQFPGGGTTTQTPSAASSIGAALIAAGSSQDNE